MAKVKKSKADTFDTFVRWGVISMVLAVIAFAIFFDVSQFHVLRETYRAAAKDAVTRIEAINMAVQSGQPAAETDLAKLRQDMPILRHYIPQPGTRNRGDEIGAILQIYTATQKAPQQLLDEQSAAAVDLLKKDPFDVAKK